jgi:serine/threonine protein kinase/tetratricopeptide (TPR) repeat protein
MINKRYSIIKKIGQGRSSVYLCNDVEIPNATFAMKVLPPDVDETEKDNFFREYFILQKLDHPNIIKSYEIGTAVHVDDESGIQTGSTFITFEYFDSNELLKSELIKSGEFLREIIIQICSALYYLHQSRYIYYDLKPENILVALNNSKPLVKLIDLGLAEYSPHMENYSIKGTAQYIAPELLKKEAHNHSVDLYSLGMMLYRLIYSQFPFQTNSEIEIYKEQIESEFTFPESENISESIIDVARKLLVKDPINRFGGALEILAELGVDDQLKLNLNFVPAKILAGRDKELYLLNNYIKDKQKTEIISIRGFEGSGKSAILNELNQLYYNSILIEDAQGKTGIDLIRYMLSKVIFSNSVFTALDEGMQKIAVELLDKADDELLKEFKPLIAKISSVCKFILLIDDFNLFDDFASELFRDTIQIMQINNIKIIIAESSEQEASTNKLYNVKEILLSSFTENQLDEFIDKSFIDSFPKEAVGKLILSHSDLMPGSIISFIKDLLQLSILQFSGSGVIVTDDQSKLSLLDQTHSAIYNLRLSNLCEKELNIVRKVSALDVVIDLNICALIVDLPIEETEKHISNIQLNNILQHFTSSQNLIFTSEGLKKHVYSQIDDKEKFHLNIADRIIEVLPSFNKNELARQYELACKYEHCFNVFEAELLEAEKHSAFAYMRNILEHLLKLPLSVISMDKVKLKLIEVYYKLSDFNTALKIIETFQKSELIEEKTNNVKTIQAGSLIGLGDFESGKKIINDLLERINDDEEKQRLRVELAYADFEQKKYEDAEDVCDLVLSNSELNAELKGRCYNLKGMRKIYQDNDFNSALSEFNKALISFKEADSQRRVAGMEVNIGNIYTLLSDYTKAENHWQIALEINRSVGNLEQEGLILLNLGIFYFFKGRYDQAIESYDKAKNIFLTLGNHLNHGLALLNLGEAYSAVCEYEKSLYSLEKAEKLFIQIENYEELAEVFLVLGKLYYIIGFRDKLEETLKKFEENLNHNRLPEKHNLNLRFLILLLSSTDDVKIKVDDLKAVRDEYKSYDDKSCYIDCINLLIKKLILDEKYSDALTETNQKYFLDLCSQNSILEAEREYFLGIISQNYASDKLLPPLEHFEKAYVLVKDESVAEITWKILLAMSELYIERGNLSKAKTFTIYGKELIYFISENIELPRLRAAYLKKQERLKAIQKFESFYSH